MLENSQEFAFPCYLGPREIPERWFGRFSDFIFVNTKIQIEVWALALIEDILVEVSCSQFFWPGWCDLKSQSIQLFLDF